MEPRRPKHKQQPPLVVSLEELEHALLQADTYDGVASEDTASIDVVHTHASMVFRLPSRVYKVKKPVDYGFLDFSTLYKRFQACYAEVQLNQRLASDVYVGVVPVSMQRATRKITVRCGDFWTPEKSSLLDYWLNDAYGEIIEWAVHMHRLSDHDTLLHKLEEDELTPSMLRAVADRLVAFHRDARRGPTIDPFGNADVVRRNIDQNFAQTSKHVQDTVSVRVYERVRALSYERLEELEPVIAARKQHGYTCDSHGDLRLEHIYVQPPPENDPKPQSPRSPHQFVILDCIEFNEHFRYGDPLSDAAFLMMDVWRMGRPDLARCFQQQYLQTSLHDTPDMSKLFAFYAAYRAVVRAKISGFRAQDEKLDTAHRERARQDARCYWLVALTLLSRPRDRPCLILVGGLPATGKSSVAKMLANDESTMHWIRADAIRKELLHHLPSQQTIPITGISTAINDDLPDLDGDDGSMVLTTRHGSYEEGLYAPAMTQRTYDEMLIRSIGHLREGARVVVDATFRNPEHRSQFIDAARSEGALFALILCECDREIAKGRMLARKNDLSEATWDVFERMEHAWRLDDVHNMIEVATINTEKEHELTKRRTLGFLRKLELVEYD